jgi:TM2 domain-containing membrane protein YozV
VTSTTTPTETIAVAEQKPTTTRTVVAKTPGIAVGASMIIPGFGQLYANAVVLGVIFVVAWTIPFWLILFSFLIPGLTSLGQGAPLDGVPSEGIPPGDVPLDGDPTASAASPFAGLIQSARFYLIFLLLVWVGAMVHAWFAARKFNRKNGIELQ